MRVLVCGWTGSTNLGDELVFAGLRTLFSDEDRIATVSIAPFRTVADHGVSTIGHRRPARLMAAIRSADLVVFGGGGLVQDETSPWNLPYHLSRPLLAMLADTPWIGLDLGVGPLRSSTARWLAAQLRHAHAITVRDEPSRDLLARMGVPARLAADAAFHLPEALVTGGPQADGLGRDLPGPADIAVSLRPWKPTVGATGRWLPVGWRSAHDEPSWFVPTVAAALDQASRRTGLAVRFVALQTDRDAKLHARVARAMRTPATTVVPTRHTVLRELAAARIVVAMRYHAGIGAILAGRPTVLIGYSPKVDALADSLGDGAAHRAFDRDSLASLDDAIVEQASSTVATAAVINACRRLRDRASVDREVMASVR